MNKFCIDFDYQPDFGTPEDVNDIYTLALSVDKHLQALKKGYVEDIHLDRMWASMTVYINDNPEIEQGVQDIIHEFAHTQKRGPGGTPIMRPVEDKHASSVIADFMSGKCCAATDLFEALDALPE